jgi:hypothetical protein
MSSELAVICALALVGLASFAVCISYSGGIEHWELWGPAVLGGVLGSFAVSSMGR